MASEILVSALVKEVVSKLSSSLWTEIGLLYNFTNDLEDMKGTLAQLEAVLKDAERQSDQGAAKRLWLKRLKFVAYDIDDLLSSYESKIPGEKSLNNLKLILRNFFSKSNSLIVAHKIKGMRKRLNNIAADKANFIVGSVERQEIDSRATISLLEQDHKTTIVGREEEKEELVHLLLEAKDERDFGIIPIIGFGGIGKTTLAQLLFNDERVKRAFDTRAWVYVSMKFDLKKIVEDLIENMKCSKGNAGVYKTEEAACRELRGLLKDRRFLIVLDDLWEDKWEKLDKLNTILQGGMKGSKVILTTRNENVATAMRATQFHFIELLSDEQCWVLFSQRAFRSEADRNNHELVKVGKGIVKKCKGVPLVAKALGSTMLSKVSVDSWRSVRDCNLWDLEENESPSKTRILTSLKLSYYNMPPELKICFAYCSIFPKGHIINDSDLIMQWISLGFIKTNKQYLTLEQLGLEYIDKLLCMSFLESTGYRSCMQMHDLVHDLATCIAGDETRICKGEKQNNMSTKFTRYVQLVNHKDILVGSEALPQKVKSLYCMSEKLHDRMFSDMKSLRALYFFSYKINTLPTSIGQLKGLKYLKFYNLSVTTLPNSLGNLRNLQFLSITGCYELKTMPESICGLISLTLLCIEGCNQLEALPETLCDLKSLECLYVFACRKLQFLPHNLQLLTSLEVITLWYCVGLKVLPESIGYLISLKRLSIMMCAGLVTLPNTLGELAKLEELKILDCLQLKSLPQSIKCLAGLHTVIVTGSKELAKWCNGEDWLNKDHIPNVQIEEVSDIFSFDAKTKARVAGALDDIMGGSASANIAEQFGQPQFFEALFDIASNYSKVIEEMSTKITSESISKGTSSSHQKIFYDSKLLFEFSSSPDGMIFNPPSTQSKSICKPEGASSPHQKTFDPLNLNRGKRKL